MTERVEEEEVEYWESTLYVSIKQATLIVGVHTHNSLNSYWNNGYVYEEQQQQKISQTLREREREMDGWMDGWFIV